MSDETADKKNSRHTPPEESPSSQVPQLNIHFIEKDDKSSWDTATSSGAVLTDFLNNGKLVKKFKKANGK
ncbi:MAG: hypothetical protein L3J78_04475 [Thermoplasmata archaeon]|nr:hypothetical protein [Thermoplasmata archaeon]